MHQRQVTLLFFVCTLGVAWSSLPVSEAIAQQAATTTLKFQSSYPASLTFFEHLRMFGDRVSKMTGGRVKIETLPAGMIVPAFEVLDATHKKVIDGAHTYAGYWVGKNRAAVLFGGGIAGPFGMDMFDYFGWLYEGGGLDLYEEFYRDILKMDVIPLPVSAGPPSALGWFKRPIRGWADLKGVKFRAAGLAGEVYKAAGMSIVNLPGGEIIPAAQRGVIDAAEFLGGSDDVKLGFPGVWKLHYGRSIHEYTFTTDLLVNGTVWKGLPDDVKEIMRSAAMEASTRWVARYAKVNAEATKEMISKHNVQIINTPLEVMQKFMETWDAFAKQESEKNPFFKKVLDSQKNYAALVVPYRLSMWANYDFAALHYWKNARYSKNIRPREEAPKKKP